MFMNVYLTYTPKIENKYLAYLDHNVDVITEVTDTVPYAKKNEDVLVNKEDLEKLLKNLKTKKDNLLSITTRNKFQEERLKKTKEGIEALQPILDTFDFEKNYLYVFYQ